MKSYTELESLLELERNALLTGDRKVLLRVLDKKNSLSPEVLKLDLSKNDQVRLAAKAENNEKLLEAALLGIRHAANLIAKYRTNRRQVSVYNHYGTLSKLGKISSSKLEKKA